MPVDPVSATIAGTQAVLGTIQTLTSAARIKKLMGQRKAYQTPDEIFKILNATKSLASQGYDSFSLNFLNNQVDRTTSSVLGTATRLGADPNQLSAIFDQSIQAKMKIGADNHALNMENFGKYLSALDTVAANKAAEQKSQQDIIKDKIQAAAGNQNQGVQNIGNAFSSFLSAYSAGKISDLYKPTTSSGSTMATGNPVVGLNTEWLLKNNPYARVHL